MNDPAEESHAASADGSPDHAREVRILHVDDDPDIAELTTIYLQREREAFVVDTAIGGPAALDRLDDAEFDCVVSDYDMPELTGLELLRTVRDRYPDLPFILFTGKGSEEIASEAVSAGVTDYLQKGTGQDQYTVLANRISNAVEHVRAERALRESEERYRTVVEGTHDAIYIYQDEEFRFVNSRACEITGYTEEELLERAIWDLVHPDDRERMIEFGRRRRTGEDVPSRYEARVLTKDGDVRRCEFSVQRITYDGEYAALGSVRDVTDYRRTEERYRALIEHSTDIVTVLDTDGTIHYESPSVERVLGYDPDDLVGENAFEYIHPDDRQAALETIAEALEREEFYEVQLELRFRQADGSWHWLGVAANNQADPVAEGEFVLNCRSIQTRKEREENLHRHKAKVEALHTVAMDIETCESETEVCDLALAAAENILDFDVCCINKHVDGRLPIAAISSDAPTDGSTEFTVEDGLAGKTFRTGESFVVDDVHAAPDADPQGSYHAAISVPIADWGTFQTVAEDPGSFDDDDLALVELLVSHTAAALDRIEREQELRDRGRALQEQNERLDEFASVVSHDLRNPLNVAQGRLELYMETGDEDHLPYVERSLDRIEHIVADVLALARQEGSLAIEESVSLATVAEDAWDAVETGAASLVVETTRTVRADPVRLQRLFENLYRNSVEHGRAGDAETGVTVTVGGCEGGFFVADDGRGIPPEDHDQVFESRYSTSTDGTGLGLTIVTTIAESHGWTVELASSTDGARFDVTGVDVADR
jgi:PAS domain S-box-containing protein